MPTTTESIDAIRRELPYLLHSELDALGTDLDALRDQVRRLQVAPIEEFFTARFPKRQWPWTLDDAQREYEDAFRQANLADVIGTRAEFWRPLSRFYGKLADFYAGTTTTAALSDALFAVPDAK